MNGIVKFFDAIEQLASSDVRGLRDAAKHRQLIVIANFRRPGIACLQAISAGRFSGENRRRCDTVFAVLAECVLVDTTHAGLAGLMSRSARDPRHGLSKELLKLAH